MVTLRSEMLRLQGLLSSGLISEAEFKQCERERRGAVLRQSGRFAKHGLASPVYKETRGVISAVRSITGAQPESVQRNLSRSVKFWNGKAAPEVAGRDALIKLDRQLVKDGFKSMLVKVVKHSSPRRTQPTTVMAAAIVDGVPDIMQALKAALSGE